MDTFVYKDHKKLRCGYTTGTCAAIAAQGAVRFLLTGSWKETEEIMTPKGVPVCVSLEEKTSGDSWAECAVRKDAGDDYDVTNGILVYARAEFVKDKSFCEKAHMPRPENSVSGSVRERSENCLKLNVGKRQETERPVQRNVCSKVFKTPSTSLKLPSDGLLTIHSVRASVGIIIAASLYLRYKSKKDCDTALSSA